MLWLDGKEVEGTVAPFDLRDRGLMLGDGLFDTSLVVNGRMVWSREHFDRLAEGCRRLDILLDRSAIAATARLAAGKVGTGTLRITVTRGPAPRGLVPPDSCVPSVIMAAGPGQPAALFQPVRIATTAIRRNELSPMSGIKSLAYLDAILAVREARAAGAEEALFLNTAGHVACCATGNLFTVRGNVIVTPPVSDGILPGIVRGVLIEAASACGAHVQERTLTMSQVLSAESVFMTNSLRLVSLITSIDGHESARPAHPVVASLARMLADMIEQKCGPWRPSLEDQTG